MNLVKLAKYRNKEAAKALREAADKLENGEVAGAVLALQYGLNDHRAGVFGSYQQNPAAALKATFVMECRLRGDLLPIFGGSM